MEKIKTAATEFGSLDRMIDLLSRKTRKRVDKTVDGDPVIARIDHGRLIADCECNGAELVDPVDLRFFCFSCGNQATGGKMRPVKMESD